MSDFAADNPFPDTAWENPYSDMYTLGASQELGADMALHVDGVYIKSDKFNAGNQINEARFPARSGAVSAVGPYQSDPGRRLAGLPGAPDAAAEAAVEQQPVHRLLHVVACHRQFLQRDVDGQHQ